MRKLQEIFDVVIAAKIYPRRVGDCLISSDYMCIALQSSACGLTQCEVNKALVSIGKYISVYHNKRVHTLFKALEVNNKPNSTLAMLAIYKNWAKRPKLERFTNETIA